MAKHLRTPSVQGTHPVAAELPAPLFLANRVQHRRYFFFAAAPALPAGLAISCGGWERCSPNYAVSRDSFDFFGLEYVAEGYGSYLFQGRETELKPGILFGYTPESPHVITTSKERPLVKYFLDFCGSRAAEAFEKLALNAGGTTWLSQPEDIRALFEQILEAGRDPGGLSRRLCTSLFEVLLLRIEQHALRPEEAACRTAKIYMRAMRQLSAEFRTIHSTRELLRQLGITQAYLARLFQRYGEGSPHQVLTSMKMTEAATLLVGEGYSVAAAATAVGYTDPYHFSRAFKMFYGIAPSRFQTSRRL